MQNGTISLKVTPYVGTYDGQEHNALSNICVEPSDAKLEYSLDGENYVTEMPKIKDTSEFTVTVVASKEGYKTVSTTETIKVNRAEGKLTLSSYSGTSTNGNDLVFAVSENTGDLSATSSDTNIATVSINGNTMTVKPTGKTIGTTIITIKSSSNINYNEKTVTYLATIKNPIFTGDSGVGCYADTNGDGIPDGIIFEDFKKGGSGLWCGETYSVSTISSTKNYYVSESNYNGKFGTKNVLSATGSGSERFYVMSLNDYNNSTTGKYEDFKYVENGAWHVPLQNEWVAFGNSFGITRNNYSSFGLKNVYMAVDSAQNPVKVDIVDNRMSEPGRTSSTRYYLRLVRIF